MSEELSNDTPPHRSALAIVSLLGLVFAVYWPVVGFEFVNWDDPWYVLNNPLIKSWHPANLWKIATEMSVKNYAPLTTFSLLLDHTFFGLHAAGYHIVNVLLHAVNTLLVCLLVSRLTGHRSAGLITAALFAVHPVQIETVAWVSSRKTLLCSLFMLASSLCWLRTDRSDRHELWGTLFLALALLSKAAAIVLPPIVVVYDVLLARKSATESIPRQLIPTCLCLMLLGITMSAQNLYMGGVRGHMELSKLHILAVDSVILWRYVGMLLVPSNLSLLYDPPTSGIATSVVFAVLGWCVVGGLCWRWRHSQPGVVFAVVCWFFLLAPVLNLFPITTLMNDRYLYLPCLCLFSLAALAGVRLVAWGRSQEYGESIVASYRRQLAVNSAAAFMIAAIVCGYALLSTQRLPVWQSNQTLWQRTVGQMPQLAVVQIQWADELHSSGYDQAAIAALQLALTRCDPDTGDRGRILERLRSWKPQTAQTATSFVSLERNESNRANDATP